MSDQVLYEAPGVIVTQAKLKVGSKTFPLRNVTAIDLISIEPNRTLPFAIILCSVILGSCGLLGDNYGFLAICLIGIAGAVALVVTQKRRHAILLETASGSKNVWTTTNISHAEGVRESLEEAVS